MKYDSPKTTAWEAGEDEVEKKMTSGFDKTKRGAEEGCESQLASSFVMEEYVGRKTPKDFIRIPSTVKTEGEEFEELATDRRYR